LLLALKYFSHGAGVICNPYNLLQDLDCQNFALLSQVKDLAFLEGCDPSLRSG